MEHSILFVDDESSILTSLRRQLRDLPYELSFALNGNAGLDAIKKNHFSVIISDMRMSEMDGVELLRNAAEISNDTVRIILTGYADINAAVSAINEAKIDAYITKPWTKSELVSEIEKGIKIYEQRFLEKKRLDELLTENENNVKNIEKLSQLAMVDQLTGLANRRHFDEHIAQEWSRALRNNTSIAFLMIDIDHFKLINDTLGHAEGDRVLKEIAGILNEAMQRPGDFVARYGGEEFAVILPETNEVKHISEFLRLAVKKVKVKDNIDDRSVTISIGAGIYQSSETSVMTSTEFIRIADEALYEAKNTGRDRVVIRDVQ